MKANHNPPAAGQAAHTPTLPIGIYSPSNAPEHIRIIDSKNFTLFDSQNADVWPMSPDIRAFVARACNNHAALVEALEGCVKWMEFTIEQLQTHNQGDRLNWGGPISKARATLAAASSTP